MSPPQVPGRINHPLHISHYSLWLSSLCPSLHFALDCSCIHLSPQLASTECPKAKEDALLVETVGAGAVPLVREGPHLQQDLTAQGFLTRSGRLVLLEEEWSKEEAGIGRAGGVHRPERKLGQEKQKKGIRSEGTGRPSPLIHFCSHLVQHHHLLNSSHPSRQRVHSP